MSTAARTSGEPAGDALDADHEHHSAGAAPPAGRLLMEPLSRLGAPHRTGCCPLFVRVAGSSPRLLRSVDRLGEQVAHLEAELGQHGAGVAPCAASEHDLTVRALEHAEARVLVSVAGAECPPTGAILLDAFEPLEKLCGVHSDHRPDTSPTNARPSGSLAASSSARRHAAMHSPCWAKARCWNRSGMCTNSQHRAHAGTGSLPHHRKIAPLSFCDDISPHRARPSSLKRRAWRTPNSRATSLR